MVTKKKNARREVIVNSKLPQPVLSIGTFTSFQIQIPFRIRSQQEEKENKENKHLLKTYLKWLRSMSFKPFLKQYAFVHYSMLSVVSHFFLENKYPTFPPQNEYNHTCSSIVRGLTHMVVLYRYLAH
jgi:hypothetical protein